MNINTPPHNALNLLADHPERFAAQGAVVATWRTYRGRRLGPYYRLTWRENRRQHSVYLGADGPLVDEVRRLLHQAHTARRLKREHRRNRQLFRENVVRPLEQYVKEVHPVEAYVDLQKCGHTVPIWFCENDFRQEMPACPRACCTMDLGCVTTVT